MLVNTFTQRRTQTNIPNIRTSKHIPHITRTHTRIHSHTHTHLHYYIHTHKHVHKCKRLTYYCKIYMKNSIDHNKFEVKVDTSFSSFRDESLFYKVVKQTFTFFKMLSQPLFSSDFIWGERCNFPMVYSDVPRNFCM